MLSDGKTIVRTYIGMEYYEVLDLPNLVDIQLSSYEKFLQKELVVSGKLPEAIGMEEVFQTVFPIESPNGDMILEYDRYFLDEGT